MKLEKKKARDIGDATNVQNSMNGTTKSAERKYSIYVPFEVMDFLGNDLMIVSPKRFSKIKAFRYLLSRHIQEMNVIDIKLILRAKMVSDNPTIVVANLSKEELDKMAQLSLTQLSSASSHISSRETK